MSSSADVKLQHLEAMAREFCCKKAFWGWLPCQPSGKCPFGRTPPKKASDPRCEDVTVEMWDDVLKKEAQDAKI